MEPHQECAYDHIVLYDGHTTDARSLGRFCGSKLPHSVAASDNKMLLVFKSDASVQRRGFLAKHVTGLIYIQDNLAGSYFDKLDGSYLKHFLSKVKRVLLLKSLNFLVGLTLNVGLTFYSGSYILL